MNKKLNNFYNVNFEKTGVYFDDEWLNYLNHLNESTNNTNISILYDKWLFLIENNIKYDYLKKWQYELFEFLKTSSPELLGYSLSEINGCVGIDNVHPVDVYVYFQLPYKNINNSIIIDDNIKKHIEIIAEKHGYTISYYFEENDDIFGVAFRPNYTKDLTDFIYNECNGILYHICPKQIYSKIKKTGLIPKWGNKHQRMYAPRICFFTQYPSPLLKYTQNLANGVIKDNPKYKNYNEYVLLKIELKNISAPYHFYNDTEYPLETIACFTYDTIHPKYIKLIETIKI